VLGWVMLAAVLVIIWRAWRWSRQISAESAVAARVGLAVTAVLFTSVLTVWVLPVL